MDISGGREEVGKGPSQRKEMVLGQLKGEEQTFKDRLSLNLGPKPCWVAYSLGECYGPQTLICERGIIRAAIRASWI